MAKRHLELGVFAPTRGNHGDNLEENPRKAYEE
jgi:hypothetical protein